MTRGKIDFRSALLGGLVAALLVGLMPPVAAAVGDALKLGEKNNSAQRTELKGRADTANLKIINSADGTALSLIVSPGTPPLKVNSPKRVAKLNADRVDGHHASDFMTACRQGTIGAYALIDVSAAADVPGTGGVLDSYACTGEDVLVAKQSVGRYAVIVDDPDPGNDTIGTQFGLGTPVASLAQTFDNSIVSIRGPYQCSFSVPPYWICWDVTIRAAADGSPVDADFSVLFPGNLTTALDSAPNASPREALPQLDGADG